MKRNNVLLKIRLRLYTNYINNFQSTQAEQHLALTLSEESQHTTPFYLGADISRADN